MTKYLIVKEGSTTEPGPVLSDFAQAVVAAPDAETARGTLGVGSAGEKDESAFATAAQGALAASAIQPADLVTVTQAEAEAGTETERRAWTAERVKQAIVAWITANLAVAWAQRFTALSGKAAPVDADELGLVDSADSGNPKKLTWANIKATLKAYFDALYVAQADLATVSQAEAEAGTATSRRAWTSERVKQAIVAWITANLATFWAQRFTALSGKATPVDADELGLIDSAASGAPKKLTWASLKAALNTYFGAIYKTIAAADAQDAQHRADVAEKVVTREVEFGVEGGVAQPRILNLGTGGAVEVDALGIELRGLNADGSWRMRLAMSVANRLFQEQISAASATAIFQSLGLDVSLTTPLVDAVTVQAGTVSADQANLTAIDADEAVVDALTALAASVETATIGEATADKLVLGAGGPKLVGAAGASVLATEDGLEALGVDMLGRLRFAPDPSTVNRLIGHLGIGAPLDNTQLVAIGDSLTKGTGASYEEAYWNVLSDLTGRPAAQVAQGGMVAKQVSALWGTERIHLTVTGGSIPASGGVAVTSDIDILVNGGLHQTAYTARGFLAGIEGTLSTDTSGNYTFTRLSSGSAVAVDETNNRFVLSATGTAFNPGLGAYYDATKMVCLGRNGPRSTDAERRETLVHICNILRASSARYDNGYVFSVPNSSAEPSGTSAYDDVMALNQLLQNTFGPRFIDWRSYLVNYGIYDAGISPTAQDLTDMANDVIPESFRSDTTHLNALGYELWGNYAFNFIR